MVVGFDRGLGDLFRRAFISTVQHGEIGSTAPEIHLTHFRVYFAFSQVVCG